MSTKFITLILTIHEQQINISGYHENCLLNVIRYIFLFWNHVRNKKGKVR